jgi:hypothetical protein
MKLLLHITYGSTKCFDSEILQSFWISINVFHYVAKVFHFAFPAVLLVRYLFTFFTAASADVTAYSFKCTSQLLTAIT